MAFEFNFFYQNLILPTVLGHVYQNLFMCLNAYSHAHMFIVTVQTIHLYTLLISLSNCNKIFCIELLHQN